MKAIFETRFAKIGETSAHYSTNEMIQVTRYTQDGITYVCAGDVSTSVSDAMKAAKSKLLTGEKLADDMERVDGCCTWSVVK